MELNKNSERLGTKPILPLLLKLSIPGIIGMAVQALYNVVDSIFIGHLSKEALSALSLAFPIQIVLIAIGVGTGVGTSSLISRLLGQRQPHRANNAAEHVFLVTLLYGVIVGSFGYFFGGELIKLFTSDLTLIKLGEEYIRIIMMGSFALFFPIIANNILRGEGNTFAPMLATIAGAVINIILDPFLIFGIGIFPRLGVAGAAYATVFARLVSGVFISYILFYGQNQIELKLREFKFEPSILIQIYKVGLPAMTMQFLGSIMIGGVNKIVVNYSTTAIAVVGIYFKLQSFVFMPIFGLNQGYMPIIGYNYGHNNPQRIKKTMKYGTMVALSFALIGFFIFQLFSVELIRLFNQNPELLKIGPIALKRISLAFPIIGIAIIGSSTFQALGKGLPSLILSFLRQFIVLLPTMYWLGKTKGLNALWFAFPLSELVSSVILAVWLSITLKKVFSEIVEKPSPAK